MKIICRDCKQIFIFTDGEQAFFKAKLLSNPVRCKECRVSHKAHYDPYRGWESTMCSRIPQKTRHTRVHYPPHVVGGFRQLPTNKYLYFNYNRSNTDPMAFPITKSASTSNWLLLMTASLLP